MCFWIFDLLAHKSNVRFYCIVKLFHPVTQTNLLGSDEGFSGQRTGVLSEDSKAGPQESIKGSKENPRTLSQDQHSPDSILLGGNM